MSDQSSGPRRPHTGPTTGSAAAPSIPGAESQIHTGPGSEPRGEPQIRGVGSGSDAASTPHLLRQLVDDVALLLRKELALASSEVRESLHDARQGAISMASGGGVLYAGFLFLLLSATFGLAEVMPAWLAALIVGGVVAIIGVVMVTAGSKQMKPGNFAPERTMESMRKDRDMVARQTS